MLNSFYESFSGSLGVCDHGILFIYHCVAFHSAAFVNHDVNAAGSVITDGIFRFILLPAFHFGSYICSIRLRLRSFSCSAFNDIMVSFPTDGIVAYVLIISQLRFTRSVALSAVAET